MSLTNSLHTDSVMLPWTLTKPSLFSWPWDKNHVMNHPSENLVYVLWEEGVWGPPPRVGTNCWTSYRLTWHHSGCSAQQQQNAHTLYLAAMVVISQRSLACSRCYSYVLQFYKISIQHPKQERSLFAGREGTWEGEAEKLKKVVLALQT